MTLLPNESHNFIYHTLVLGKKLFFSKQHGWQIIKKTAINWATVVSTAPAIRSTRQIYFVRIIPKFGQETGKESTGGALMYALSIL